MELGEVTRCKNNRARSHISCVCLLYYSHTIHIYIYIYNDRHGHDNM